MVGFYKDQGYTTAEAFFNHLADRAARVSIEDLLSMLPVAVESQGAELTSGEVAHVESLFATLDQDHSGILERQEFLRLHGQDAAGFYSLLDTDGDGDISMAEWIR